MSKCNMSCYNECQREIYLDNKCILHCIKNDYQKDRHSGLLLNFYKEFINYTIEQLFKHNRLFNDKYSKDDIANYLNSGNFNNDEYNEAFKKNIFIPNCIHFPARDSRDSYDYQKILNLFGRIHFNYCEFYLSSLDIKNVECFFQDCKFHNRWTLYNYKILQNEDDVIYQACEFKKDICNYSPEEKKLAIFDYSQFDYTCKFNSKIELSRCHFKDMIFNTNQNNYLDKNNIKKVIFENCIFESKFRLNNFQIQVFHIIDTIFEDKVELKENSLNDFLIENSNFEKLVDLFGSQFDKFKICKSIFNDFVGFENCVFGTENKEKEEIATFKYATFLDFVNFRNTNFKSGLDIENINLKEAPNFLNINIEFKNTNRETFRIIKYSFDKIHNNIEANKYFIQEMKKYREELKKKPFIGNMQEKFIFYINDKISSFGQSYVKPIIWLIVFVCIYNCIIYGYEKNWLYNIYPPANQYIQYVINILNNIPKSIIPFEKFLKKDLEFISMLFHIIFSILIWQIIVSIKRYTKR